MKGLKVMLQLKFNTVELYWTLDHPIYINEESSNDRNTFSTQSKHISWSGGQIMSNTSRVIKRESLIVAKIFFAFINADMCFYDLW